MLSPSVARQLIALVAGDGDGGRRARGGARPPGGARAARARGRAGGRPRRRQRRDRGRAAHQRGDRQGARLAAAGQARASTTACRSRCSCRKRASTRRSTSLESTSTEWRAATVAFHPKRKSAKQTEGRSSARLVEQRTQEHSEGGVRKPSNRALASGPSYCVRTTRSARSGRRTCWLLVRNASGWRSGPATAPRSHGSRVALPLLVVAVA